MGYQIKIKGLLLLVICVFITSIFYSLVGDEKPFVQIYKNDIYLSFDKIKRVVVPAVAEKGSYYLRASRNSDISEKYLKYLGFTPDPKLFHHNISHNVTLPTFVTAIKTGEVPLLKGLIKSISDYYAKATLIVYDLNLEEKETEQVYKICNSTLSCSLRKFNFESFPSHVNDLKLYAFRPIIIQEVLHQTGAALWLEANYHLTFDAFSKAEKIFKEAKDEGILCWTIDEPTSAMTHPRMFEYFNTSEENYHFFRMIETSSFVLFNTARVHKELMLPWVRCALSSDCIAPTGAQNHGCRYDKKPLFRYSGCHHYDMSALNILLGMMFNFKADNYSANENDKFFRKVAIEDLYEDTSKEIGTNLTYNLKAQLRGKRDT